MMAYQDNFILLITMVRVRLAQVIRIILPSDLVSIISNMKWEELHRQVEIHSIRGILPSVHHRRVSSKRC